MSVNKKVTAPPGSALIPHRPRRSPAASSTQRRPPGCPPRRAPGPTPDHTNRPLERTLRPRPVLPELAPSKRRRPAPASTRWPLTWQLSRPLADATATRQPRLHRYQETASCTPRHPAAGKKLRPPSAPAAAGGSSTRHISAQSWAICVQQPENPARFSAARIRRSGPPEGGVPAPSHVPLTALLITNGDAGLCIRMRCRNSLTSAEEGVRSRPRTRRSPSSEQAADGSAMQQLPRIAAVLAALLGAVHYG